MTVAPAGPTAVRVAPVVREVPVRGTRSFTATALDPYGNSVPATFAWRVTPPALGKIVPGAAGTATFTAARVVRRGIVDVVAMTPAGPIEGSAHLTVTPARLRIGSIGYRRIRSGVQVKVAARDGARRPVSGALVRILVRRDGRGHFSGRAVTGASGKTRYAIRVRGTGCLTLSVTQVRAAGFTWDGRTPRNRFCVRR